MTGSPTDDPAFSFRSMFSPLQSPNMTLPDEQTKEPPVPTTQSRSSLSPISYYDEQPFRKFHFHKLSDTTNGSTDSSPTTTISTVDDSSATEPSPGSSPESPPPSTFAAGMLRPRTSDDSRPFFELQKQALPKKGRNLKNLAVDTSRNTRGSSTSSLPLPPVESVATISSPGFVKPPTPQKRKPSNLGLTLLTPSSSKAPPQEIKLAIPPTPAFGRPGTLRHFQSSPSLPLVPQKIGPPLSLRIQPTLDTIISPLSAQPQPSAVEEEEQNFDIPLSMEEKPEAYPDGPICVYEPYIDLYLEPNAAQCRQYDVVYNVASEVLNPLVEHVASPTDEPEIRIDGGGGIQYAPRRDRLSTPSNEAASSSFDSSPTTPKAAPSETTSLSSGHPSGQKEPEYIHIKWEHNSDIVPDLYGLVKSIDEKVQEKKRTLIHCQCGVSRSASLVVAYGLYKNPSLSVQEAYDAVKKRSKWIGPNMNLIMQLQEFRTSLHRGGRLAADRGLSPLTPSSAVSEWGGPFSRNPQGRDEPLSAGVVPITPAQNTAGSAIFSPGPSSAPSAFEWPLTSGPPPPPGQRARAISAVKPGSAYVNPAGRVVPMVPMLKIVEPEVPVLTVSASVTSSPDQSQESDSNTPTDLSSARSEQFAMTPLQPSPEVDAADSFGLMSPTTTEFSSSPFDRSALLAQLGMGSMNSDSLPRRSVSLKAKQKVKQSEHGQHLTSQDRLPRLRGKISSPSLREQQHLQDLQAKIAASLPHRPQQTSSKIETIDEPLMSPRATEFTQNPFALAFPVPEVSVSQPDNEAPRSTVQDPRSPAHKGVSPITRNIMDVL